MSDELKFLDKALDDATAASIETEVREVKIALRALCVAARQDCPKAAFIDLDDSDQGDWAWVTEVLDADGEEIEEMEDWRYQERYSMHLYAQRADVLEPFLRDGTERGHYKRNPMQCTIDIEKVLREVKVP